MRKITSSADAWGLHIRIRDKNACFKRLSSLCLSKVLGASPLWAHQNVKEWMQALKPDVPQAETNDVKTRILLVARELFSSNGFGTTTVRDIVELSGANVAAVNYHFGSKDALIQEVALDVLRPVQFDRQARLSAVMREARDGPPALEAVLAAFIAPLVYAPCGRDGGRLVVRLIMQMWVEPGLTLHKFITREYNRNARRFVLAFQAALPHLATNDVVWRYEAMRGMVMHLLANCDPRSAKFRLLSHDGFDMHDCRNEDLLGILINSAIPLMQRPNSLIPEALATTRGGVT
ncbi:TetR family transcriptional regulator [Acetobacteraceae bacterium KSS8]|uniref:TetR family transcriptional regulator n=1 Tax=Endosaccharibacter trunci TaxID=2812733 RepID=A0ABT1W7Q9_9PROT|nr:TetR family transcriptional regulator [Acetobacteraceae bacterium KSS8]